MASKDLAGKFVIVYDIKLPDDKVKPQAFFFGYDSGKPCVLPFEAQLYTAFSQALEALPLAVRIGQKTDPEHLQKPYIVEIPSAA